MKKRSIFLLTFSMIVTPALINPSQPTINETKEKTIHAGLRMMSEVISLIEKKAIRRVDFQQFMVEALKAAIPTTDAHSAFFSQKSYRQMIETTSGKFSGIGVSIMSKLPEDDGLTIIEVINGGPAYKAELKENDEIIEVDGEKLRGLSTDEVISKLKGPRKTKVKIKVIRKKKLHEFTVTRDIVKHEVSVAYHFSKPNVYYLSLKLFSQNAAKRMQQILENVSKHKANGIIIDLRRNPGGILNTAIEMAGLFLKKGSLVVYTKDRDGNVISEHKTKRNPIFNSDIPLFFLVDNFTASASEILAGTLRHYSDKFHGKDKKKLMVFVVGTETFGKGSVQEVIPISHGCALKLTTMLYYLPNNQSIQAAGIVPDFIVKQKTYPQKDIKMIKELYGTERSIKYHITREEVERINGKKNLDTEKIKKEEKKEEKETWEEKRKKALNEDVQVQTSLNLIHLLGVGQACIPHEVSTRQKALAFLKKHFVTDEEFEISKVVIKQ